VKYFEEKILAGEWKKCEKYIGSFTKSNEN
jgi:hypothetical protein